MNEREVYVVGGYIYIEKERNCSMFKMGVVLVNGE